LIIPVEVVRSSHELEEWGQEVQLGLATGIAKKGEERVGSLPSDLVAGADEGCPPHGVS
jgi:hypothetical protein